jgi:D-lactate dehydrogenase
MMPMKAVAYSTRSFEREYLAKANHKKHDITLITNALGMETAGYAAGKEVVIVFTNDDVSAGVIDKLATLGVKFIISRSTGTDHIDKSAAAMHGIEVFNVPAYSPQAIAEHTVGMAFALNRCLIKADKNSHGFNFTNEGLVGFNFFGKTIGLIGLGHTGQAVARIFLGLGCVVIAFDPFFPDEALNVKAVSMKDLLESSDVISLHLPLTESTRHIINAITIKQMKAGVMLINTSRGALVNTLDALAALRTGKIGYLGLDVYEHEHGLFFENHEDDIVKDPLLLKLMDFPNVLITPHQAYLTREALLQIADQTIKNMDMACIPDRHQQD